MNDFLTRLATRALLPSVDVQPRLPSRFEPGSFDQEAAGPAADGIPVPSPPDASRPEGRSEASAAREPAPGSISVRLDRSDAILPGRVRAPAAEVPPVPPHPKAKEISVEHEAPVSGADTRNATDVESLKASPGLRTGEEMVRRMAPVAPIATIPRAPAGREPFGPVRPLLAARVATAEAARPEAEVATNVTLPRIVPAQTPSATPLRLPRDSAPRHSEPKRDAAPRVIQVTIGRLEIRASTSTRSPVPRASEQPPRAMSLEEYLLRKGTGDSR